MSNTTREINKITTAIIRICTKLIVAALLVLLLYEAVAKGFSFGYQVFYSKAAEESPGRDVSVVLEDGTTIAEAAGLLKEKGLIENKFSFRFQSLFYEYETVYPGTYELNTSMTPKEILKLLNEKPMEEILPAEAAKEKAAAAAAAAVRETESQAEAKEIPESVAAETMESQEPGAARELSNESQEGEMAGEVLPEEQDPETVIYDEDEAEGGWIDDIAED